MSSINLTLPRALHPLILNFDAKTSVWADLDGVLYLMLHKKPQGLSVSLQLCGPLTHQPLSNLKVTHIVGLKVP
jgi:hypothetical protein